MYRENRVSTSRRDAQGFINSAYIGVIFGILLSLVAVFGGK